MDRLYALFSGHFHVIQGGARGADNQAWLAAKKLGIAVITEHPKWKEYGRRAGILRNIAMLDKNPQYVVALWDGNSRGTLHTIESAVGLYRIPTVIVRM